MSGAKKIRVFIVDDHPVVRDGLGCVINDQTDMEVIAEAGDGVLAIDLYRQHIPDVTLVDLHMPQMGGVKMIETVRKEFPQARFVVLTTFDGDEDIYRAIHAGAQGYVLKDMFRGEILEAIRRVHEGQRVLPPHVAEKLAQRVAKVPLSPREREVLQLVARGESNKTIGAKLGISEGTIKSHMVNIFGKLEVDDRTAAVRVAVQRGIIQL